MLTAPTPTGPHRHWLDCNIADLDIARHSGVEIVPAVPLAALRLLLEVLARGSARMGDRYRHLAGTVAVGGSTHVHAVSAGRRDVGLESPA